MTFQFREQKTSRQIIKHQQFHMGMTTEGNGSNNRTSFHRNTGKSNSLCDTHKRNLVPFFERLTRKSISHTKKRNVNIHLGSRYPDTWRLLV